MFRRHPVGGVGDEGSRARNEARSSPKKQVQTICKLLAVNPAANAAGERSFSSARPQSEDLAKIPDGRRKV